MGRVRRSSRWTGVGIVSALIMGAAVVLAPASAQAAPSPPADSGFTDDFATAASLSAWTTSTGTWSQTSASDGSLTASGAGSERLLLRTGQMLGAVSTIAGDFRDTGSVGWNGLAVNVGADKGSSNRDYVVFRIKQGTSGTGAWQLVRITASNWDGAALRVLASGTSGSYDSSATYTLTLDATPAGFSLGVAKNGQTVAIGANGANTVSASLESGDTLPGGGVGVFSQGGTPLVGKVSVTTSGTSSVDSFTGADGATFGTGWTAHDRAPWAVSGSQAVVPTGGTNRVLSRDDVLLGDVFSAQVDVAAGAGSSAWNGLALNYGVNGYYAVRFRAPDATRPDYAWQLLRIRFDAEQDLDKNTTQLASFATIGAVDASKPIRIGVRSSSVGTLDITFSQSSAGGTPNQRVSVAGGSVVLADGDVSTGGRAGLYGGFGTGAFDDFRVVTGGLHTSAFGDDFDRASAPTAGLQWREARGDWMIADNRARLEYTEPSSSGAGRALLLPVGIDQSDRDSSVRAVVRFDAPRAPSTQGDQLAWNGVALNARSWRRDGDNARMEAYYSLELRVSGTSAFWRLARKDGPAWPTAVDSGSFPAIPGGAYILNLQQKDTNADRLSYSISSGATVLLAERSNLVTADDAPRIQGGSAGLVSYYGEASFDDFQSRSSKEIVETAPDAVGTEGAAPRVTATDQTDAFNSHQPAAAPVEAVQVGLTAGKSTVPQSILTDGTTQYVAYYDENAELRVGKRTIDPANPSNSQSQFVTNVVQDSTHPWIAEESFDGQYPLATWTTAAGTWSVESGKATAVASPGVEQLLLRKNIVVGSTFSVAADSTNTSTAADWNGIVVGASDPNNNGRFDYLVFRMKQGVGGGAWQFIRITDGNWTAPSVITSGAVAGNVAGGTYRLAVTGTAANSYRLEISKDGQPVANSAVGTQLPATVNVTGANQISRGAVGLFASDGKVLIDNVRIETPSTTRALYDAHNLIAMAVDQQNQLHIVANVHASQLIYYRSKSGTDNLADFTFSSELVPTAGLSGTEKTDEVAFNASITYPEFSIEKDHATANRPLYFTARQGASGNGTWRVYKFENGVWTHVATPFSSAGDSPTTSYSAYPTSLLKNRSEDGYYHVAWVWRRNGGATDPVDAYSNTRIGAAKTLDFEHWVPESDPGTAGVSTTAPFSYSGTTGLYLIDDVPVRGGQLGLNIVLDSTGKAVISYVKLDDAAYGTSTAASGASALDILKSRYLNGPGRTQVYLARFHMTPTPANPTGGAWDRSRLTNLNVRWSPIGAGTIPSDFRLGTPTLDKANSATHESILRVPYAIQGAPNTDLKGAVLVVDEASLRVVANVGSDNPWPESIKAVPDPATGRDAGYLGTLTAWDTKSTFADGSFYVMRWQGYNPQQFTGELTPEGAQENSDRIGPWEQDAAKARLTDRGMLPLTPRQLWVYRLKYAP
ncbi:BNR-4 repeat-containing protein [Arthrobacter sp. NPDC090010]|uniref:BNR-4 repeat-containing protein n=1 Tax=Arthrobacter sp. NPDC090010 TaxID=3363942 RepID=UPI003817317B